MELDSKIKSLVLYLMLIVSKMALPLLQHSEMIIVEKSCLDIFHATNKKYFFGLLKEDFLKKLNPEY